ncbi:MAG: VWA domain-containing protein [Planctomycetota bacterium]|jgi:Ca-activated chloride channel family protein
MDIRFENLDALHWAWLVAVVAAVSVIGLRLQRRRLRRFASAAVLAHLVPASAWTRGILRSAMVVAAMGFLVVALLDPRWGSSIEELPQQGVDVFIAVDLSRSMLAEDATPNRLDRARQLIGDLLEAMGPDRAGLITFAGTATLACPLTVDHGALALSLMEADPALVGRGGSLVGDALRLAGDSFTDDIKDSKAVVVFSDGEDHGSFPVDAARSLWEEKGVRVFTVGIGDAGDGARIPIVGPGGGRRYVLHENQEVWSKMDDATLRDLALQGGGAFIPAGTSNVDMTEVYDQHIAPVTRRDFGSGRVERFHARFQWFVVPALLLLLIEAGLRDTPRRSARTEKTP